MQRTNKGGEGHFRDGKELEGLKERFGAAWSERPILEAETFGRGFVFNHVKSGSQRKSVRRSALKVKQEFIKLLVKVLCMCMWENSKSMYLKKYGLEKSPLKYFGYMVD